MQARTEEKKSRFRIEQLEERIAPRTVTITIANSAVSGNGTINTGGGPATGSGSLTLPTGTTLSGSLPT
jgi:hypothetical protein